MRWDWTYRYGRLLLVSAVVTVVLLSAALITAVRLGDRGGDAGCLVGSWRTVASEQHLSADLGTLVLADDGPVETYRDDGTGTVDYGEGVTYRVAGTPLGLADIDLVFSGTARFDYVLDDGTIAYRNISSQISQSGAGVPDLSTSISEGPFGYRCEGDTLTFHTDAKYDARLVRLD